MRKILDKLRWLAIERFVPINIEYNHYNGFLIELFTISFINYMEARSLFSLNFANNFLEFDILFISVLSLERPINTNIKVKCIKTLYRTVYKGNAFEIGEKYKIIEEDQEFYYIEDIKGNLFNFYKFGFILTEKDENCLYYLFDDYFKIVE